MAREEEQVGPVFLVCDQSGNSGEGATTGTGDSGSRCDVCGVACLRGRLSRRRDTRMRPALDVELSVQVTSWDRDHVSACNDSDNPIATHLRCSRAPGFLGFGEEFHVCHGDNVPRRLLAAAPGDNLAAGSAVHGPGAGSGAFESVHRCRHDFFVHDGNFHRNQQGQLQAVRHQNSFHLHDRDSHWRWWCAAATQCIGSPRWCFSFLVVGCKMESFPEGSHRRQCCVRTGFRTDEIGGRLEVGVGEGCRSDDYYSERVLQPCWPFSLRLLHARWQCHCSSVSSG